MSQYIQHSSHGHLLTCFYLECGYKCDVCLEDGKGWSYRCHACNFDVHPFCVWAPSLLYHPFHNYCGHQLTFIPRPPWKNPRPCCACGDSVKGFGYHCAWGSCGYVLHPSCAQLPESLSLPAPLGENEQTLRLLPSLTSACSWCGQGGFGWAYATSSSTYNIHVGCVKRVMDGSARRLELARAAAGASSRVVETQQRGHAGNAGNRVFTKAAKIIGGAIIDGIVGNLISGFFNN